MELNQLTFTHIFEQWQRGFLKTHTLIREIVTFWARDELKELGHSLQCQWYLNPLTHNNYVILTKSAVF